MSYGPRTPQSILGGLNEVDGKEWNKIPKEGRRLDTEDGGMQKAWVEGGTAKLNGLW